MNGNGYEAFTEDLDEAVGDYEDDSEWAAVLEDDEARRGARQRRPVRTGRGAGYYQPRPTGRPVTQTQYQSTLKKISEDVKANAAAIKTVSARVDSLAADQKKQAELLKKDGFGRKKELAQLKNGLQMASILPLITSKSITLASATEIGGTQVAAGTKISVAPDALTALLPMFLLGDGLGGGGSGGDSNNMLIMALALSGSLGK